MYLPHISNICIILSLFDADNKKNEADIVIPCLIPGNVRVQTYVLFDEFARCGHFLSVRSCNMVTK
jgi:hypothetical protein